MACANQSIFDHVTERAVNPAWAPAERGSALGRCQDLLRIWLQRSRQRRALSELDDHLLRDIGVARREAVREAAKPFWAFHEDNE
jgi:uncharacterized protein YjiS (DUF1127 family)